MIVALLFATLVHADWELGILYNQTTDLIIEQAWKYASSNKIRQLPSLTAVIQKANSAKRTSMIFEYPVDSRGLAFSGKTVHGQEVTIYVDGQVSHSIESNRKKTKTITSFPQWCQSSDGSYCARALMRSGINGQLVAKYDGQVYDNPKQVFDLSIQGSAGHYIVSLTPA